MSLMRLMEAIKFLFTKMSWMKFVAKTLMLAVTHARYQTLVVSQELVMITNTA